MMNTGLFTQSLARLCKNSVESLDDLFFVPPPCAISKETWDSDAKKARQLGIRPTINLSTGFFHSLSMEPTRPARVSRFMRYWSWLAGRLISRPLGAYP